MRLLHTSDWHLGQKFINQGREAEHEAALDWLLETIRSKGVEVLVVAGDIFDVSSPPITAEELYYRFLTRLKTTDCRHVVITGGNHDSPSKLNAPRGLLRALDVHVVGSTGDDLAEEIVEIRDRAGEVQGLVVAVPFLRDKDFKFLIPGETFGARVRRIQAGIHRHYAALADLVEQRLDQLGRRVPVVATGHLYTQGALAAPEQANIYVGNLENIAADQFPAIFDYIALGHIHRAQAIGGREHIRYSGSLIPLSFSELDDVKGVVLADLEPGRGVVNLRELGLPTFRRLLTIRGPLEDVEEKLVAANQPDDPLRAWVEVIVESDYALPGVDRRLRELAAGFNMELLKVRNDRRYTTLEESVEVEALEDLSIEEVFRKRCAGETEEELEHLVQTFRELRDWANQQAERLR
jgi:exonuclease SbcD